MDLAKLFEDMEPTIIDDRRWFHRYPEISFKEENTSRQIQNKLNNIGIPYELLPPNHGIIATIQGVKPGKTLVLRADIDALPVIEQTAHSFKSENSGVMHACGHDAHIAMVLGAARALWQLRDQIHGTVLCLFQAAEEVGYGHQEALDYFDNIGGVDAIIGLHIWSTLADSELLLLPGSIFSGVKGFKIDVIGQGGHGARPDLVSDPIKASCELILRLSSIPSNYYDVMDHTVVSTCMINAGTSGNVFPSEASFKGTMRYFKDGADSTIEKMIRRICDGIEIIHNVKVLITFDDGAPPVLCNPELVQRARFLAEQVNGLRLSKQTDPLSAGDNIGFLLERYPGFYGILGAEISNDSGQVFPQHHPSFDLSENTFRKGSEFMTRFALDFLKSSE